MALQEVQGIIEILRQAHARQLAQQELQQRKEQQESVANQNLMRMDQEDKRFAEEVKQQKIANEAAAKMMDLNLKMKQLAGAGEGQKLIEEYQRTGNPPAGAQMSPMAQGTGGASFSPANPAQATGQMMQIPGIDQPFEVATPPVAMQRRADLERIANRPKVDAKIEESLALAGAKAESDAASDERDFLRSQMMKAQDDERNNANIRSREKIALAEIAGRNAVASLSRGLPPEWQNYDISPHIQDALTGKLSREAFKSMALPPAVKTAIEIGVKNGDGMFLSKEQLKSAEDFEGLQDVVGLMDELLAVLPKTEGSGKLSGLKSSAVGLANTFNKDITNLEKRLEGYAVKIGRATSKNDRVSNEDAQRVGMAFFPSKSELFRNNVDKRNDMVKMVNGAVDARFSNLTKTQRDIIKQRIGLSDIPLYNLPSGKKASPQAPQGPSSSGPIRKYFDAQGNEIAAPAGR